MNAGTWVAIVAAIIAAVSVYFNGQYTRAAKRAANAADEQTRIQQQLRTDAAQPYVWADVRPDETTGTLLNLVIGNSGPTIATFVRVRIDPPLPAIDELKERAEAAQAWLAEGIRSIAPGRTYTWPLGQGFNLLNGSGPLTHTFTIDANGPFGPLPATTHLVDLADMRGTLDRPSSLYQLTKAVENLTQTLRRQAMKDAAGPAAPGPADTSSG
jgi:hypothetical protein